MIKEKIIAEKFDEYCASVKNDVLDWLYSPKFVELVEEELQDDIEDWNSEHGTTGYMDALRGLLPSMDTDQILRINGVQAVVVAYLDLYELLSACEAAENRRHELRKDMPEDQWNAFLSNPACPSLDVETNNFPAAIEAMCDWIEEQKGWAENFLKKS